MSAYQGVITHITSKIENGEWGPGFKLPSTRRLSDDLGVGITTVVNAIRSLQARGLIEGRAGAGRYVAARDTNDLPTGNDAA